MSDRRLRDLLLEMLEGKSAHLDLEAALEGMPVGRVGERPEGVEHSVWELVEHLRRALHDLVEFSRDPDYESPPWPEGYWPQAASPGSEGEWERAVEEYGELLEEMKAMMGDPGRDLLEPFPWGDGQNLAREAMLAFDHAGYHIGQIVQVRRLLGEWPPPE